MSDWQKARVTFTDADGKEVSAVMCMERAYNTMAYVDSGDVDGGMLMAWNPDDPVKVEPIRELPTGLGAVVRAVFRDESTGVGEDVLWVRRDGGAWISNSPERHASTDGLLAAAESYEILSEGIEL